MLRRWWTDKYKLPWISLYLEDQTIFELLVEFYEDRFEEDPQAMLLSGKNAEGEYDFSDAIDDPLFAKWEKEINQGLTPDLEEGLSEKAKEKLKKERALANKAQALAQQIEVDEGALQQEAINNKALVAMKNNPKYATKKATNLDPKALLGHGK